MTYSVGGLIQATDINGFVSTGTPNFNNIWSTGATNSGYGQTALATVAVGDTVAQNPWNSLVNNMAKAAVHQGTTVTAMSAPVTGNKITFLSGLSTNLGLINTNRLNAALQGGTATNVATTTSTWNDKLTVTFTVAFASHNAARYFFNAGGQLGINSSHPAGTGTTINTLISDLCSDAGTVWLSAPSTGTISLAGTTYSGVTKAGGSNPAGATVNTNYGFYALTSTSTQIFKQFSDLVFGSYGTGTFMNISASYNGTGTITFVVVYDEVPNSIDVSTGTAATLTVRSPSTSQLTNTWGTPTLSNTITVTNAPPTSLTFLLVAGGGGGGISDTAAAAGGGGAGGFLEYTVANPGASTATFTVGSGGARGTNGSNTVLTFNSVTQTAIGGGAGGGTTNAGYGQTGGSGGGGGLQLGGNQAGPGTPGQGFSGQDDWFAQSGAGGGAGGVPPTPNGNATGGPGKLWIDNIYYAGGGAANGTHAPTNGTGGIGGGGRATQYATGSVNGTDGLGGGGGAGGSATAGVGGSGVLVVSYAGVPVYTGGTIYQYGGRTFHKFTSSGTFTIT